MGRNPARTYDASALTHKRHLDALFKGNGQSCRALYGKLVAPSATRRNIDPPHGLLEEAGRSSINFRQHDSEPTATTFRIKRQNRILGALQTCPGQIGPFHGAQK